MREIAANFASTYAGVGALLFFFVFFVGVVFWIYRPGSKEKYRKDSEIPLKD